MQDWSKDEWSDIANLLANMIEKYAAVLDIENLPEPPKCFCKKKPEKSSAAFTDAA